MKKLLLIVVIIWALLIFYNKFVAPVIVPFFKEHKGNVDFFGRSTPTLDKINNE
ncbi:MAG: hypothetical protein V2A72_05470 [Candidatus Omnitrophota bacterium]